MLSLKIIFPLCCFLRVISNIFYINTWKLTLKYEKHIYSNIFVGKYSFTGVCPDTGSGHSFTCCLTQPQKNWKPDIYPLHTQPEIFPKHFWHTSNSCTIAGFSPIPAQHATDNISAMTTRMHLYKQQKKEPSALSSFKVTKVTYAHSAQRVQTDSKVRAPHACGIEMGTSKVPCVWRAAIDGHGFIFISSHAC